MKHSKIVVKFSPEPTAKVSAHTVKDANDTGKFPYNSVSMSWEVEMDSKDIKKMGPPLHYVLRKEGVLDKKALCGEEIKGKKKPNILSVCEKCKQELDRINAERLKEGKQEISMNIRDLVEANWQVKGKKNEQKAG